MVGYPELSDFKENKGAELPLHVEQPLSKAPHSKSRCQSVLQALISLWILYFLLSDAGVLYQWCTGSFSPLITSNASLRNPSYLIEAANGAVASENKRCSEIGVNIMKDGGNAVDAAIAALFCTGVVNMFSYVEYPFVHYVSSLKQTDRSGIGGGGFMTVRIPPNSTHNQSEGWTIDFRETAPALAFPDMFVEDPTKARYGGLSVGVPGEVLGLEEAHKRWGKLPWEKLVIPAAKLAQGWTVDVELGKRIQVRVSQIIVNYALIFLSGTGHCYSARIGKMFLHLTADY